MALGTRLFGTLLKSNAVVDVQAETPSGTAGGTILAWADVATRIDVLVTQAGGVRDFAAGTTNERASHTVAGRHPALNRADVRLRVRQAGPGLAHLVGRYLAVVGGQAHAAGSGGLLRERVNLQCTVLETPVDSGREL